MRSIKWEIGAALVAMIVVMAGCSQKPLESDASKAPVKSAATAPQDKAGADTPVIVDDPSKPAAPDGKKDAPPVDEPKEVLPDVAAKVGEETITGQDLQRNVDLNLQMMEARGMMLKLNKDQKREVLEDMVREKIMEQVAKKAGITSTEEEAKAEIDKSKKGGTDEEFQEYLKSANLTEPQLVEILRGRIIKDKFYDQKKKDIAVTDEEIGKEYESLKADGRLERPDKTADFSHILARAGGDDEKASNDAKAKIDAAKARVAGGEKFEDVAKAVSEDPTSAARGGAYPNTSAGDMPKEIDEKLFTQPLNEVSEPFKTKFGWHIMKVTGIHQPGTVALDEIKDLIRERLQNQKAQAAVDAMIDEAAKNTAIEINYPEGSPKGLTPKKEAPPAGAPEPAPEAAAPAPDAAPAAPEPEPQSVTVPANPQ